jgi:NAD(P)-dependent dehydrogenase (short-subunit alcohol dehydrogenase family)
MVDRMSAAPVGTVSVMNALSKALGIAVSLALTAAVPVISQAQTAATKQQQAVLVTGAGTGIGRKITEKLAADGYFVYAGARKDEDLKALDAIKNVQAVRLDVTKPQDIAATLETIKHGGRGLYGLVNNAGIGSEATVAEMKPEEFDLMMAVNMTAPYRLTQTFEPLIVEAQGRITNIGSISGILASPTLSAYVMSKHAIEAFTDSLAQELAPLGGTANVVEPGNYNTDIVKHEIERGVAPPGTSPDLSNSKPPDEVADAVEKALFEPNPKRRYLVVPNQHGAEVTIKKQIEQLVQLNEGQPFTYDRAALIKMLDEALSTARPRTK